MIEIYNIFFQLVIFLSIFSFPFNSKLLKIINFDNFTVYEIFLINFIIFSTLCLLFSITNLNYKFLFYIFLIFGFFSFIIELFKNKKNFLNFFFLLFIILNLLIYFEVASLLTLQWDGLATWSMKMNNFYFGQSYENLSNITYPHQPHIGPYIWAVFYDNSVLKYEYFGRFFYVFVFLTSVFTLKSNFKENINYYLTTLLFLLIVFLSYDPYLFGGYQEYLVFSLILFIGNFLYKIFNHNKINNYQVILFTLILNLTLWTKQECFAYIFILQLIFIFLKQPSIFQKLISSFLFIIILLIKLEYSFVNFLSDPHFNFKEILLFDYKLIIYKLTFITKHILIVFFKYPIWLLIILSYFVIIFNRDSNDSFLNILNLFAILNLGLIYFVFLTTISGFEYMVKTVLDRMIFQTTGFYILIIIICINKISLKSNHKFLKD